MRNPIRNVRANLRALAITIPNLRTSLRTVRVQLVAWGITGGISYLWSSEPDFQQILAIFLGVNVVLGAVSGAVSAVTARERRRKNA